MNKLFNKFLLMSTLFFLFCACKKDEKRAVLQMGAASTQLTASATTLLLDSANAAHTNGITFSWPAVSYGEQVAVTYTLQIDSITDNFIKPLNISLGNNLSKSFSVLEFNNL